MNANKMMALAQQGEVRDTTEQDQKQFESDMLKLDFTRQRHEWLDDSLTKQLLTALGVEVTNLQQSIESLTVASFADNSEQILKNTTRLTELRKVINYVQTGKYSARA